MELVCDLTELKTAVGLAAAAAPANHSKEVLKSIKMSVSHANGKSTARFCATDCETSLEVTMPVLRSSFVGDCLLPTQRFLGILRELRDSEVVLEITQSSITICCGFSEFRLSIGEAADFPPMDEISAADYIGVNAKLLARSLKRTAYASDVNSTRYALGGVFMQVEGTKLFCVATDSRRLSVSSCDCVLHGTIDWKAVGGFPVVHNKAVALLSRLLAEMGTEDECHVAFTSNKVAFRCGDSLLVATRIQGRFPDWTKVMPQQFGSSVSLVCAAVASAVRQSQIVTTEESRGVDFDFSEKMLRLCSEAASVGKSKIELPIALEGAAVSCKVDPRYVADFLKSIDSGDQFLFQMNSSDEPILMSMGDDYQYLIMPLSRE